MDGDEEKIWQIGPPPAGTQPAEQALNGVWAMGTGEATPQRKQNTSQWNFAPPEGAGLGEGGAGGGRRGVWREPSPN